MSKMVHEDTVGSAGSEGGGAMGSTVREGPSERVRGSSTLEDGQDVVDTELSGRKPFQENNRPFDFYSSLISVAGLFKTKSAKTPVVVRSCLFILANSTCTNSRWILN